MAESSVLLTKFPKAGRRETDPVHQCLKDVIAQFALLTSQVHFPEAAASGPKEGVTVVIEAADANDVKMLFGDNKVKRVTVSVTGGTATGETITNEKGEAHATDIICGLYKGAGAVLVKATGAGTVTLALADTDTTGVTVTDTITVTLA